jgi:2-amino-4-hydroxy-6-hydroxymethyldihydropteridine diphosphokinase
MKKVYLSFGSNIEPRLEHLSQALHLLKKHEINLITLSSIYKTPALTLPDNQSELNSQPFLNMVGLFETNLNPHELLECIKNIETEVNRLDRGRWGGREIDIDILLFENETINAKDLTIPHSQIKNRDFVILPLQEISPELYMEIRFEKKLEKINAEILNWL